MSSGVERYRPRWADTAEAVDAESPYVGLEPKYQPVLPARLDSDNGQSWLPASSLADTVRLTQRLLHYASHDVVHGVQLDFADLRRSGSEVTRLGMMRVEPFEEGSFIIPCVLSEDEHQVLTGDGHKTFTGRDVLERFDESLQILSSDDDAERRISIGMLRTLREANRVLARGSAFIEYSPFLRRSLRVDVEFVSRVRYAIDRRTGTRELADSIEGSLTAIDFERRTFNLKDANGVTIQGNYIDFITPNMQSALRRWVRIEGTVEIKAGEPTFIQAHDVEELNEPPRREQR